MFELSLHSSRLSSFFVYLSCPREFLRYHCTKSNEGGWKKIQSLVFSRFSVHPCSKELITRDNNKTYSRKKKKQLQISDLNIHYFLILKWICFFIIIYCHSPGVGLFYHLLVAGTICILCIPVSKRECASNNGTTGQWYVNLSNENLLLFSLHFGWELPSTLEGLFIIIW